MLEDARDESMEHLEKLKQAMQKSSADADAVNTLQVRRPAPSHAAPPRVLRAPSTAPLPSSEIALTRAVRARAIVGCVLLQVKADEAVEAERLAREKLEALERKLKGEMDGETSEARLKRMLAEQRKQMQSEHELIRLELEEQLEAERKKNKPKPKPKPPEEPAATDVEGTGKRDVTSNMKIRAEDFFQADSDGNVELDFGEFLAMITARRTADGARHSRTPRHAAHHAAHHSPAQRRLRTAPPDASPSVPFAVPSARSAPSVRSSPRACVHPLHPRATRRAHRAWLLCRQARGERGGDPQPLRLARPRQGRHRTRRRERTRGAPARWSAQPPPRARPRRSLDLI